MNAATISPIAPPDARMERLVSLAAAPLKPRRFIERSVREVPEAEETTP